VKCGDCSDPRGVASIYCDRCRERRRLRKVRRDEKRKADAKCRQCGADPLPSNILCERCHRARYENNRDRAEALASASACIQCGVPCDGLRCAACRGAIKDRRSRRVAEGKCSSCTKRPIVTKTICQVCLDRLNAAAAKRKEERIARGECPLCETPPRPALVGQVCLDHWFFGAAGRATGSTKNTKAVAALWEAQGGRCALTGFPLTPSAAATLDHKIPKSRGGSRGLENIQWTAWEANRIKGAFTPEEFVALCRMVVAHADGLPYDPPASLIEILRTSKPAVRYAALPKASDQ
jgi:hypothetical protein